MDSQRFDDLARLLARPATRRTLWRGALAAVAGWVLSRPSARVSAQEGCGTQYESCEENPCCPGFDCCGDVCCGEGTTCCLFGETGNVGQCCSNDFQACCDGQCADLTLSLDCGSCGNVCESGLCCDRVCIEQPDPNNCGQCGTRCPPCYACVGEGFDGTCVPTCSESEVCADGICVPACPPDTVDCGDGICRDLQTDDTHCGRCGNQCGYDPPAELSICIGGECQCPPGTVVCQDNVDFVDYYNVCVDPLTNRRHCGDCGNYCPQQVLGSICVGGQCVCSEGERPCGGACCPADQECRDGRCGSCAEGQTLCRDPYGDVCADLATDPDNCGYCGIDCSFSCADGICRPHDYVEDMPTPPLPTATGGPVLAPTSPAGQLFAPTPTTGPVTLPGTGTGARRRSSDRRSLPLIGATAAMSTALAAWFRNRVRVSEKSEQE